MLTCAKLHASMNHDGKMLTSAGLKRIFQKPNISVGMAHCFMGLRVRVGVRVRARVRARI